MRKLGVAGLCVAALTVLAATPSGAALKVTHSQPATATTYPPQVALLNANEPDPHQAQFCGGTLIAPQWVVTAGHCIFGVGIDVLVGRINLTGTGGDRIPSDRSVPHPGYGGAPFRDIALVHLSRPAPSSVALAKLAVPGDEPLDIVGTSMQLTGWGGTEDDDNSGTVKQNYPNELRVGTLPVVTGSTCTNVDPTYDPVSEICAGSGTATAPGVDSCFGDSGGPLVAKGPDNRQYEVGIVSRGPTCGEGPSIYTSVAAFRDWIETTTRVQLSSFSDIAGSIHEPTIERVALKQVTTGFPDGTFRPNDAVNRGQMASFLVRALQLTPKSGTRFSDTAGNVHEPDINALVDAGITTGFSDGTYRPYAPVSRAQMASFLVRALKLTPQPGTRFSDTAHNAHEADINALVDAGITQGFPDKTFRPDADVSRGQMATFLVRGIFPTPAIQAPIN